MRVPKERAQTGKQKRDILNRLYAVWMQFPSLRLGQLITNATSNTELVEDADLFALEDQTLAELCEDYRKRTTE